MSAEAYPDDYLTAAAGVVEAAKDLDAARTKARAADEARLQAHVEQTEAEKALSEALEKLKHASTGRVRE